MNKNKTSEINDALLLNSIKGKKAEENKMKISKLNLLFFLILFDKYKIVTNNIIKSDPLWGSNLSEIERKKLVTDFGKPIIEKK